MQWEVWLAAALETLEGWRAAAAAGWGALSPGLRAALALAGAGLAGAALAALALARPARRRARRLGRLLAEEAAARRAAEAELAAERRAQEARLGELREMEARLARHFEALAAGALDRNAERFLGLVSERFEAHRGEAEAALGAREAAVAGMVGPVREALSAFERRVGELERERAGAYAGLREAAARLEAGQHALRGETARLVQALRAPKTRGRWGEMQLRRVLELSGMTEHADFATEVTQATEDGPRRPDAVIRLPGGRSLAVDAKTPLDAYLDALEAEPGGRDHGEALDRHARAMRAQARALGAKAYQEGLPGSPDFVVMFIPGEAFLSAAMERDPGLFEDALAARVLVASPATLVALAKSAALGWREARLAESAREIAEEARRLHDRLRGFGAHLDGVGKALTRAVERYNAAVGAMEGRVMPSARRFEALGVAPEAETGAGPGAVEAGVRALSAPDLARAGEAGEATAAE